MIQPWAPRIPVKIWPSAVIYRGLVQKHATDSSTWPLYGASDTRYYRYANLIELDSTINYCRPTFTLQAYVICTITQWSPQIPSNGIGKYTFILDTEPTEKWYGQFWHFIVTLSWTNWSFIFFTTFYDLESSGTVLVLSLSPYE